MLTRRLAPLIAGNFFVATSFMIVAGLLNEISNSLQLSISQAGWLIAGFALMAGVCGPVLATFGSRIDRRKLLSVTLGICALSSVAAALSDTYSQLMAARMIAAASAAVYSSQAAATVSMLLKPEERGPALGRLMTGWAVGSVVGGPLTVLIGTHFGWRAAMVSVAVGGGIVALMVWRTVPPNVHVPPLNLQRWIDVVRSPALRLLTLTSALSSVGNSLVFSYLAPMMQDLHSASGGVLASLYFINGLGGVAGSLLAIALISRMSATRVANTSILFVICVLAIWPFGGAMLTAVFLMQFFWSAGTSGFPASQQTRLVAVAPTLAAGTISMNSSVSYLGTTVGATLGAYAWPFTGALYLPWVGAFFVCLALAVSLIGERAARREEASAI